MAVWGYEFYLLVLKVSLTRSLRSLVRDTFSTSKIKFVSPRGHEISSILAVGILLYQIQIPTVSGLRFETLSVYEQHNLDRNHQTIYELPRK